MKRYIDNGRVLREEIAADICDGTLTKDDIRILANDPEIKASFIGTTFTKKTTKDNWNLRYLETLPNYSVAEAFNEDYLLYMAEVREYISSKNKSFLNKNWWWIAIAIFIIGIGIYAIIKTRN